MRLFVPKVSFPLTVADFQKGKKKMGEHCETLRRGGNSPKESRNWIKRLAWSYEMGKTEPQRVWKGKREGSASAKKNGRLRESLRGSLEKKGERAITPHAATSQMADTFQ